MEMDPDLAREWIERTRRLEGLFERYSQRRATDFAPPVTTNRTGDVSVKVEDGQLSRAMALALFSAILCAVLAFITVVALIGGGMLYLNMKDHVDAIYMMAPQLNQSPGTKSP